MISVVGAGDVADEFNRLAKDVPNDANKVLEETANEVERRAKQIGAERWEKRPMVSVPTINAQVEDGYAYVEVASRGGFFQEIGTVNHPPQPALQPALDSQRETFYQKLVRIAGGS